MTRDNLSASSDGRNEARSNDVGSCSKSGEEMEQESTPTRNKRSFKRKLLEDLLPDNTPPTHDQVSKKCKVQSPENSDTEHCTSNKSLDNPQAISIEKSTLINDMSSTFPEKSFIDLNRVKRKLLYSTNKTSTENKPSPKKITIDDFYKSVIVLDESDKIVPVKGPRPIEFNHLSQEFVTVSDLKNKLADIDATITGNKMNDQEKTILSSIHISPKLNDSLNNFQFTEVEEFHCPKITANIMVSSSNEPTKLRTTDGIQLVDKNVSSSCKEIEENSGKSMALFKECNLTRDMTFEQKFREHKQNDIENDEDLPCGRKYSESPEQGDISLKIKENLTGYVNFSSDKSRSKFRDGFQDSVAFDEISSPCDGLELKTPSQTDMFDTRTPSKNENMHVELISESDMFDNDSPLKSTPLKDEIMTPELSNNSLLLSRSLSIKRVKQNLRLLLTPISETAVGNPKSEKQETLCNSFTEADTLLEVEPERITHHVKSASEPILKAEISSPSKAKKIKSNSDFIGFSTSVWYNSLNESIDSKAIIETEGSEEKEKVELLLGSIIDPKPQDVLSRADFSEDLNPTQSTLVQFSTASGAVVRASQFSLKKAKALMEDLVEENTNPLNDINDQNGKSAISEDIPQFEISKESLMKAKALLGDALESVDSKTDCKQRVKIDAAPSNPGSSDFHFSTAAGVIMQASKQSLRKMKALFSDIMNEENDYEPNDYKQTMTSSLKLSTEAKRGSPVPSCSKDSSSTISPINTSSKKKIDYKNPIQGLKSRASLIPGNISEENSKYPAKVDNIRISDSSQVSMVDMPSLKTFKSSEISIKNPVSEKVLSSNHIRNVEEKDSISNNPRRDNSKSLPTFPNQTSRASGNPSEEARQPFGFSTAAGGFARISEQSLARARALMQEDNLFDISKEESYNFSSLGDEAILLLKEESSKIKFNDSSENSRSSSQRSKIIPCPEKENETVTTNEKRKIMSQDLSVFETMQCTPCDSPIQSCSKLDTNDLPSNSKGLKRQLNSTTLNSNDKVFSFSSAGGKQVGISNEVLERVKQKFKDIIESADDNDFKPTNLSFGGKNNSETGAEVQKCPGLNENTTDSSFENKASLEQVKSSDFLGDDSFCHDSICTQTLLKMSNRNKPSVLESAAPTSGINTSEETSSSNVKSKMQNDLSIEPSDVLQNSSLSFSTANGTKLQISEESLLKVKLRFKEELDLNEIVLGENEVRSSFSPTVSCEKIDSQRRLKKVKGVVAQEKTDLQQPLIKQNVSFSIKQEIKVKDPEKSLQKLIVPDSAQVQICETERPFLNMQSFSFSTAKGGKVNISEESLEKVKLKFKNELDSSNFGQIEDINSQSPQEKQNVSLGMAKNSKIDISIESLEKVKQLFKDDFDLKETGQIEDNKLLKSIKSKEGFYFSTAQGGKVSISEESLQKVKKLFNDEIDTNEIGQDENDKILQTSFQEQSISFSTPKSSNSTSKGHIQKCKLKSQTDSKETDQDEKTVVTTPKGWKETISDESLLNVKRQLKDDCDVKENYLAGVINLGKISVKKGRLSLSNSKRGNASTSGEGLLKSQTKTITDVDTKKSGLIESMDIGKPSLLNQSFSFSTANGGKVNISNESLQKVKQQFKDDLDSKVVNNTEMTILLTPCESNPSLTCSTAQVGKTTVSDEYLKEVTKQFKGELDMKQPVKGDTVSIEVESENESLSVVNPSQSSLSFCFSTALGEKIAISNKSLEKVKDLFKGELGIEEPGKADKISSGGSVEYAGFTFTTAQGGRVNVSEESLQRVKRQFKDDFNAKVENNKEVISSLNPCQNNLSRGFSTPLGGKVSVSGKSLEKVKELFKDELDIKEADNITSGGSVQQLGFTFTTAQGGTVNVSEESLQKVKLQFKDDFNTEGENDRELISGINSFQSNLSLSLSTPRGGKVTASDKCLEKSKDLFKDELGIKEPGIAGNISLGGSLEKEGFTFTTAQGGRVDISEESLKKVKHQFREELIESLEQFEELESASSVKLKSTLKTHSFSFSTASGERRDISEECLQKIKQKFKDDLNMIEPSKTLPRPSTTLPHSKNNEILMDFTQTLEGSQLDHQLNNIEKCKSFNTGSLTNFDEQKHSLAGTEQLKKCKGEKAKEDELTRIEADMQTDENKISTTEDSKSNSNEEETSKEDNKQTNFFSQMCSEDMLLMCEVTDTAAALAQDNEAFAGSPFITSPSLVSDRSHLKPITSWSIELENDDDFIAAAQTPKKADDFSSSFSEVPTYEKRKSESLLQPSNKKVKLSDYSSDNQIDLDKVIAMRQTRRKEQQTKIESKKQNSCAISEGLYMSIRKNQALTTFMDSQLKNPQIFSQEELLETGLLEEVIDLTSKNATDFKFTACNYFSDEECFSMEGQINLDDGFTIILSNDNKIGLEEISASFLSHSNVDPSLVHQDWIKNHYRWIIWKLASLEKSFPRVASGRFLVPLNVLHQLKYRYDREIDLAERPALRRILECDSAASRRFIACVADIRKVEAEELGPSIEVELTDGWYSVWSTIDSAMEGLINKGKIKIGTKLIIHGAELVNCSDGCDPLELHTNSVRRVKWSAKMGFTKCPGPLGISMDSILPNGGLVGLTTAVVARVYPMLYMSRDSNGKSVIRNSQAENHIAAIRDKERNSKTEELYEKILKEVEGKYKKGATVKYDLKSIKKITNPEVLWRIVSSDSDASEVHAILNPDQLASLQKYHEEISAKIREEVNNILREKLEELVPSRKVTNLLKIRIADPLTECDAVVTIWRPTEDVCSLLTENRCVDFYTLNACGTREKVLQLANMKQSCYRESTLFSQTKKFERKLTEISDLVFHNSFPMFGELDVVGIVVYVKEPDKPWGVTNVYLSDIRNNFLMITFWTSLKNLGFEDLLSEGSVVAAINLHRRQGSGSYVVPSTFANEITYFSSNPSQEYLSKEIQAIKSFLAGKDTKEYLDSRKEALLSLVKERGCNVTPVRTQREGLPISRRIDLLKNYGPASPLPKTPLISSPDVHKSFKSPRINKNTPKSSRSFSNS